MNDLMSLASEAANRHRAIDPHHALESITVQLLEEKGIAPTPGLVRNIVRNAVRRFDAFGKR